MENTPIVVHLWVDPRSPWCAAALAQVLAGCELASAPTAVEVHGAILPADALAASYTGFQRAVAKDTQLAEFCASHGVPVVLRPLEELVDVDAAALIRRIHRERLRTRIDGTSPTLEESAERGVRECAAVMREVIGGAEGAGAASGEPAAAEAAASDPAADLTALELEHAKVLGIGTLPFAMVGGKFGVTGARRPEAFAQVIDAAAKEWADQDELPTEEQLNEVMNR